jgi:protein MpaA
MAASGELRPREEWGCFTAQPEVYGQSVLGQPLEVWVPQDFVPPARLLLMAGIHGEEPETTCVLSRTLRSLSEPL